MNQSSQKASMGRKVIYVFSSIEKSKLSEKNKEGWQTNVNDQAPAEVVAVHGSGQCANLKVHVDGNVPDLWMTSVNNDEGTEVDGKIKYGENTWHWPVRE